jgi:hypothetical protein
MDGGDVLAAARIDLVWGRKPDRIHAQAATKRQVCLSVARVALEIFFGAELLRVHEDAHQHWHA